MQYIKKTITIAPPGARRYSRAVGEKICPISSAEEDSGDQSEESRATNALGIKFYMKKWISQICLKT